MAAQQAEEEDEEDMQHKSLEKPWSQSSGRSRTGMSTKLPMAVNEVGSRLASEDLSGSEAWASNNARSIPGSGRTFAPQRSTSRPQSVVR
eukprot:CAMPEP_0172793196 /NCGR_PEP_ID=MMETSP1074-20121228/209358_1 /TAXON_ID=2916 /ORGANISM="Ceratium fusus, Strain PA161109" /LENGTH=89 /DNA_ID=CAMNT_0013630271 /DNA_START=365 /DNA_END=634 /DNA_ORIENTATION=+